MADAGVSATLYDETGVLRGKNLANTPEEKGFFRTIFVDANSSSPLARKFAGQEGGPCPRS
jgi:hypothetical protein